MANHEIELKFPVSDPAALQEKLPDLGFHLGTARTFEHNTLYDTPSRELRARTEILRIRQYGALWTVTHKRTTSASPIESGRYKIRLETETAIADGPALGQIFEQLGYQPVFTYEKYRTEWSAVDPATGSVTHLVLDETPIGVYAELEGPPAWIDTTLAQLNVDPSTCITASYGRLFLDWKQRTGSLAENLTFAEIAAPALAASR